MILLLGPIDLTNYQTLYNSFYGSSGDINLNTGIPTIFTTISNSFTTTQSSPITLNIPHTNKSITIDSNYFLNMYPTELKNFMSVFYYGIVCFYICFKVYSLIEDIKYLKFTEKWYPSDIYKNIL